MSIAERLAELGIELPAVTPPLAVYRPAVRMGNAVYISGQLPIRDGQVLSPGRLGDNVEIPEAYEAARVCAINALAAASSLLGNLENVRVVRTVGYVVSTPDFHDQPAVVNGASELLRDIFGEESGIGARLALGVTSLPARAAVEVELLLEVS